MRILIAEDDAISRRLLTRALTDLGHEVASAEDGAAALEEFLARSVAVVISDWMMPKLDGLGLCQGIRAASRPDYTHFILLTARADRDSYRAAMEAGVDDFLAKPLDREELAIKLRVTERVVRQRQAAEERVRMLARFPEDNHNPVLQVNAQGKILYANAASAAILADWRSPVGQCVPAKLCALIHSIFTSGHREECEVTSGERIFSFAANAVYRGESTYLYGHDITARKDAEKELIRLKNQAVELAIHDSLTGLPNRLLLKDRLAQSLAQCARDQRKLALLMVDLDNFKTINDSLGHAVGDRVLVQVGAVLRETVRASDTVCRWGGDEMVVVLNDLADRDIVPGLCRKLAAVTQERSAASGLTTPVTLSIGYAVFPDDATEPELLMQQADHALYQAKEDGRNCFREFKGFDQEDGGERKPDLLLRLGTAVEQGGIEVYYQPLVDSASGLPVGMEALARWNDAKYGWVPPDEFIPLAEDKGLINRLGARVIELSLDQLRACRAAGQEITVSINLARAQLLNPDLPRVLLDAVRARGLAPETIILEVTERQSLFEHRVSHQNMEALAAAGFRLSLDDFGSGYSSLDLVGELPFRELKIHRGLVRRIETPKGRRIVQAIVEMTKSLNLVTVAEGVETEAMVTILREIGVNKIQGYFYARPMAPAALPAYFNQFDGKTWRTAGRSVLPTGATTRPVDY